MSPTINDLILGLFDHSAQGIPTLLEHFKDLFQCENVQLCDAQSNASANDTLYLNTADYFEKAPIELHQALTLYPEKPNQVKLQVCSTENIALLITFPITASVWDYLNAPVFLSLFPHLQQATSIAYKISQHQDDLHAVQYVLEHHPLTLSCPLPVDLFSLGQNTTALKKAKPMSSPAVDQAMSAANLESQPKMSKETIVRTFKLTPSEAELSKQIFHGHSLNDIAQIRSVSKQTIRKQLQSVLKKTRCDSQEALMIKLFDTVITQLNSREINTQLDSQGA
ncbi:MAG: helix-turn-helix transcriptional regulator [Oleiphilus sp.]